jgi:HAD superfamily hydrolase (TIGR01509 family)
MAELPDAVVFDLDGTLLDTERLARIFFTEACALVGCHCEIETYESTVGLNVRQAKEIFEQNLGDEFPFGEVRELTSRWFYERINSAPVDLKQGAMEILVLVRSLNIKIGLCTSTGRKNAGRCLEFAQIFDFFEDMVCGGESENGKPSPDPYLNIARKLSIDPARSWAIEDSDNGARSAASAGFRVFQVPDQVRHGHIRDNLGVETLDSLIEISRMLNKMRL